MRLLFPQTTMMPRASCEDRRWPRDLHQLHTQDTAAGPSCTSLSSSVPMAGGPSHSLSLSQALFSWGISPCSTPRSRWTGLIGAMVSELRRHPGP